MGRNEAIDLGDLYDDTHLPRGRLHMKNIEGSWSRGGKGS